MTNDLPWEDSLLERKLESDQKDFLKTFVAFANSVRPGHTAVVLIGEKDDSTTQGVSDADELQKKIRKICEGIYPDIIWRSRVYEKEGHHCIRVEIEYSGDTPHFGGSNRSRQKSAAMKNGPSTGIAAGLPFNDFYIGHCATSRISSSAESSCSCI